MHTVAVNLTDFVQLCFVDDIKPVESQCGPVETFSRGLSGEKIFDFLNNAFWCTLYFFSNSGPPNVAGPGVTYTPFTPLSRRAWMIY